MAQYEFPRLAVLRLFWFMDYNEHKPTDDSLGVGFAFPGSSAVAPQLKAIYGTQIVHHISGPNGEQLQLETINMVVLALGKARTPAWHARSVKYIDSYWQISVSPYTLQYLYHVRVETPPCFHVWFWRLHLHDATHDCDVIYRETRPLRKQASLSTASLSRLKSGSKFHTILQRREWLRHTEFSQLHVWQFWGFVSFNASFQNEGNPCFWASGNLSFWLCSNSQGEAQTSPMDMKDSDKDLDHKCVSVGQTIALTAEFLKGPNWAN